MFQGRRVLATFLLVVGLLGTAAFYLRTAPPPGSCSALHAEKNDMTTRRAWIPQIALSLLTPLVLTVGAGAGAAQAVDPARLGTKKDPVYEKCLNQCIYFCLKPKGVNVRTRSDCLQDCKAQCAQTDAQKMLGLPKK
ncbi:Hypothetical protein NocV09_01401670 [Nannochloropsis oceanica]